MLIYRKLYSRNQLHFAADKTTTNTDNTIGSTGIMKWCAFVAARDYRAKNKVARYK